MTHSNDSSYWGRLEIKDEVLLVALILLAGAVLRLFAFTDFSNGTFHLVGTCGQLIDEAKPLFDARNPLHFEVFFYPPVAPILVASTGMLLQGVLPKALDFARYCLLFNIGVSVATLLVVYLIGRQWSVQVGLAAISFYAVTMIAVYSSDNVQMYPTFFSMLALCFFFRSVQKQTPSNLILMGVFLGLGVASKYFPIMLILMLFMVYFVAHGRKDNRECVQDGEKYISNTGTAVAWKGMLYTILIVTMGVCYVSLFHKEMVLTEFQSIYDSYPHDHQFGHHLPIINRFYHMGIIGIGAVFGVVLLGLVVPYRHGVEPWAWFQQFSKYHRLWLIPLTAMVVTLVAAIGIPAALNLNNYLKYTTWIAKGYGSADGGFFPAGKPAPSYLLSYFPESLGIPLFILSCLGIIYCLYARDRKSIFVLLIALPLYAVLELSAVKVNRFAMDLMPLFCIFAAILIVRLMKFQNARIVRTLSVLIFIFVLSYSSLYSLAWANLQGSLRVIPLETAEWINRNVPLGSQLGMKADLWIAGSPTLLPDPATLTGFEITDYTKYPDYIVLPKSLHEIIRQYAELTRSGHTYRPADWSPFEPPSQAESTVLVDLIYEQQYELVKEFEQRPSIFGITFGPQFLSGRTWLLEHTGSYGIRVYKKRVTQN
jgi:hypothetical protein